MSTQENLTTEDHKEWGVHNKEFAGKLTADDFENYQDWRAVALFYSAVHYIEVFFERKWEDEDDYKIESHKERKSQIMGSILFNHWDKYSALYDAGYNARYQCKNFSKEEVDDLKEDQFEPFISFIKENW